jgi:hypothetical protein
MAPDQPSRFWSHAKLMDAVRYQRDQHSVVPLRYSSLQLFAAAFS